MPAYLRLPPVFCIVLAALLALPVSCFVPAGAKFNDGRNHQPVLPLAPLPVPELKLRLSVPALGRRLLPVHPKTLPL